MPDFSSGLKPHKIKQPFDPNNKQFYSIQYRPKNWTANTEYKSDGDTNNADVVIPSTPNGLMYECKSGGISGATEPTFGTTEKGTTADDSVVWTAKAYDLLLNTGDTITASTWAGANGETVDSDSIVDGIQTKCRLIAVADGATSVTLTNHITVARANGDIEELDRSLIISVKEL